MPIYEYKCSACDHELEALQKISDPVIVTCPECSTDSLRKKISAVAFKLKGTGWYETDFKNKQEKKPSQATEKKAAAGDNKSASANNSDKNSKPAEKTASDKPTATATSDKANKVK